jgi:hypothetical protein
MAETAAVTRPPAKAAMPARPRDPAGLAQWLLVTLYIDLAADSLSAVADALDLGFVGRVDPDTPASFGGTLPGEGWIGAFQGLSALAQTLIFVVCGFLCLKWIYRMSLNAHALAIAPPMKISPAWGVGWFFVPFASLWKPFQGIRESWQVSAAAGAPDWHLQPVPGLLRWWWGLWLASNIVGNVSLRLQMNATNAGELLISGSLSLLQDIANVPLDVLFIFVVRRLTALQIGALSQRVFD